jgi:hypothetical protein
MPKAGKDGRGQIPERISMEERPVSFALAMGFLKAKALETPFSKAGIAKLQFRDLFLKNLV